MAVDVVRTPDEATAGAARLPLRVELPRGRRAAARLPRRGGGEAGRLLPRRADLVVPLAQGDPAGPRRRLPLHRPRLRRLRPLRQAHRPRLVHLRPPRRADGEAARGARHARRDRRRPRLGRADRAAARGRAPRSLLAHRDHGHRPLHRPPEDERHLAQIPRVRAPQRGRAGRLPGQGGLQERPGRRGDRRLRGALSRASSQRPAPAPSR